MNFPETARCIWLSVLNLFLIYVWSAFCFDMIKCGAPAPTDNKKLQGQNDNNQ
jgi:hypothetical protein